MSPTAVEEYITVLTRLKPGEMAMLRCQVGQRLDRSTQGFDLFTGLWWPIRQRSPRAPRREVAWLITKLFSTTPLTHEPGRPLAAQLWDCQPAAREGCRRFQRRFDDLLRAPIAEIEPPLRWALREVAATGRGVDWVRLTNDLSQWEETSTRWKWAELFLSNDRGRAERRKRGC